MSYAGDITRMYGGLANTLRGGLKDIGQAKLDTANMGLKRTMAEMQIPGMKLEKEKAESELAERNRPVTGGEVWNSMGKLEMATKRADDFAQEVFGAKYDPSQGVFIKADGNPVTVADRRQAGQKEGQWYALNFDPRKGIQTALNTTGIRLEQEIARDPNSDAAKQLRATRAEIQAKMADPVTMRDAYQQLYDHAVSLGGEYAQKRAERFAREIDRQNRLIDEQGRRKLELKDREGDREFQLEKQDRGFRHSERLSGIAQAGANRRADMQLRGKGGAKAQTAKEMEHLNDMAIRRAVANAKVDPDGMGGYSLVTPQQLAQLKRELNQQGIAVYAKGEKVDRPYWFTGDDQMYRIMDIIPAQPGVQPQARPPVEGAVPRQDGTWWVQKDDGWYRVESEPGTGRESTEGAGYAHAATSKPKSPAAGAAKSGSDFAQRRDHKRNVRPELPKDPDTWNVIDLKEHGRNVPAAIIEGKPVKLTEAELEYFRKHSKSTNAVQFLKDVTQKIPRGKQKLVDRSGIFKDK